jgi:hypothetical protein
MTSRQIEEYRALRDTIRERSTARVWMALAGFSVWAGLAVAAAALAPLPVATLLPLLLLMLTFEIVLALHVGVERVGRYIQVFFEDASADRGWEHQAMELGRRFPGGSPDPLFAAFFWSAIVLNLAPAVTANPTPIEWGVVGAAHSLAFARIALGRHHAAGQRARDLERFTTLKAQSNEQPAPRA